MQLLTWQRDELFQTLLDNGLQPSDFVEKYGTDSWYEVKLKANDRICFSMRFANDKEEGKYIVTRMPGDPAVPNKREWIENASWNGCLVDFREWVNTVKREVDAPNLWAKSNKALQLFASTEAPAADRFTVAELGAVQGQLRMLSQSFGASELPEAAKQKLAEICQTAMLKAETFTKRDWQNWIAGAFANAVAALELNEAQRQEVVALVRLAFGGLFLQS